MSCTHCGLCLEACPTYTLWGREPDSPRGRIVLIEQALAPDGVMTDGMAGHIDSCIGCMACMTACPEDVAYPDLLMSARPMVEKSVGRPAKDRMRRRAALTALPHAARGQALRSGPALPHYTPAQGNPRGRVGLLLGCTQRLMHSEIHTATLAVLSAEGYEVVAPRLPECCGAIEAQAGERARSLRRAQQTITAFAAVGGVDHIVASAGSCGASLKGYGHLLGTSEARAFSALATDVNELLAQSAPRASFGQLALRVAYHESCHLRHVQGVADAPRTLLHRIPGVELLELPFEAGACCGGLGLYPVTRPEASNALADRQAQALISSGAEVVVSGDHTCIGHLKRAMDRAGKPLPIYHPVEVLARAMAAGGSPP